MTRLRQIVQPLLVHEPERTSKCNHMLNALDLDVVDQARLGDRRRLASHRATLFARVVPLHASRVAAHLPRSGLVLQHVDEHFPIWIRLQPLQELLLQLGLHSG